MSTHESKLRDALELDDPLGAIYQIQLAANIIGGWVPEQAIDTRALSEHLGGLAYRLKRAALASVEPSNAPEPPKVFDIETPKPLATFERVADMSLPCPACNSDGGSCSLCRGTVMRRVSAAPPARVESPPDAKYPCARCGVMRTAAEGGTTFTVCDDCWCATMHAPGVTCPNCEGPNPDHLRAIRLELEQITSLTANHDVVGHSINKAVFQCARRALQSLANARTGAPQIPDADRLRAALSPFPSATIQAVMDCIMPVLRAGVQPSAPMPVPADLWEIVENEAWTIEAVDEYDGLAGDGDVRWDVIQHHMDEPRKRVVGTGRTPKAAVLNALAAPTPEGDEDG